MDLPDLVRTHRRTHADSPYLFAGEWGIQIRDANPSEPRG